MERKFFFVYEETVYHILPSRFLIASFGSLSLSGCGFANRIAFGLFNGMLEVVAHCPTVTVYFSIAERLWRSSRSLLSTRDLNCPGSPAQLSPSTSIIMYSGSDILLPVTYGRDGVCIGTNDRDFFVYRDNSSLSSIILFDLRMETFVRLNNEDCIGDDDEILILQKQYIVVTDQLDGLCYTNVFDIGNNYSAPIITQKGYYANIGIITGFTFIVASRQNTTTSQLSATAQTAKTQLPAITLTTTTTQPSATAQSSVTTQPSGTAQTSVPSGTAQTTVSSGTAQTNTTPGPPYTIVRSPPTIQPTVIAQPTANAKIQPTVMTPLLSTITSQLSETAQPTPNNTQNSDVLAFLCLIPAIAIFAILICVACLIQR